MASACTFAASFMPSSFLGWRCRVIGELRVAVTLQPSLVPLKSRVRAEARAVGLSLTHKFAVPVRLSDALENLFAPYPAAGNQGASPCDDSSRTDKASRPVGRHVAIRCPVPRGLKDHSRTSNASHQIIRNSGTGTRWTTDENSAEIATSIHLQHLQHTTPLSLPHRGEQALR
jgi:hypothetical protein